MDLGHRFTDPLTSLNWSKWSSVVGPTTFSGGKISMYPTDTSAAWADTQSFALFNNVTGSGSSFMFKIETETGAAPMIGINGVSGWVYLHFYNNMIDLQDWTSGSSFAYSPSMYLRVRYDDNIEYLILDSSLDGITWTQRAYLYVSDYDVFDPRSVYISFDAGWESNKTTQISQINIPQTTNRYLVGSGNWNNDNTTIWSYNTGGAPGAIPPASSNFVYMPNNFTATLSGNVACNAVSHTNGTLNLSSYALNIGGGPAGHAFLESTGSTARTINLGSGTLIIGQPGQNSTSEQLLELSGTNLTFNAGTSLIVLNALKSGMLNSNRRFTTGSKTFNDVKINLGESSNSVTLLLSGSSTFRSLIIQSKNSAAHTVVTDGFTITKLIAIGSSPSSPLTIKPDGEWLSFITVNAMTGSIFGENLAIGSEGDSSEVGVRLNVYPDNDHDIGYIGTSSIVYGGSIGWNLSDPPKISTLVDPLTTAPGSNPNWVASDVSAISLVSTGLDGGGYEIANTSTLRPKLVSSDTYDFIDSWVVVESISSGGYKPNAPVFVNTTELDTDIPSSLWGFTDGMSPIALMGHTSHTGQSSYNSRIGSDTGLFRFKIGSDGSVSIQDHVGGSWVEWNYDDSHDISLSSDELMQFRSARLTLGATFGTMGGGSYTSTTIGSINPNLNQPPTIAPNTPDLKKFSTRTPTLEFTGTDPEGNPITYQIQIHTEDDFGEYNGGGGPPISQ